MYALFFFHEGIKRLCTNSVIFDSVHHLNQTLKFVKIWKFGVPSFDIFLFKYNYGILLLEALLINSSLWHFQVDPYPKDLDPPVKTSRIRILNFELTQLFSLGWVSANQRRLPLESNRSYQSINQLWSCKPTFRTNQPTH